MRGKWRQRAQERQQGRNLSLGIGPAQLTTARDDALLEILNPLEEASQVADGLVHLQLLEVCGDAG